MAKERNMSKWISCVIVTIMTLLNFAYCTNNSNNNSLEVDSFAFKGEAIDHPANFDKDTIVTPENIESLYRLFKLDTLFYGEYYLVRSKKSYTSSRYLSRLIRMKDGKQVAAQNFYDSEINPDNVVKLGNRIIVGLNSLGLNNYDSTFHYTSQKCRVIILTDSLKPIKGYRYYSQKGYTHIESLMQNSDSTFYCFIVSGKVETEQYVCYQFCANDNYKSVGSPWRKIWNSYYIQSDQMDFSTPDWGNDISDMELLRMRKDAGKKDSLLSNIKSFEEKDSTKRVAIESPKVSVPIIKQSIPKDFVLVPCGILKKREWSNKSENYYYKEVKIDSFYISKYELTQIQYEKIMGVLNPEHYSFIIDPYDDTKKKKVRGDDIPVNCTYAEFAHYCNLRSQKEGCDGFYEINGNHVSYNKNGNGYRLLFEDEWIYAAKGGRNEKFRFVGSNNIKEVAWYGGNSGNLPHPVGKKKPNSLDLYDMSGNISEMLETKSHHHRGFHIEAGNDYLTWISGGEFGSESTGYYWIDNNRRTGTRLAFVPRKNL